MNHTIRGLPRDDILGGGGGRHIIAREQGPLAKLIAEEPEMRKPLDEVRRRKTLEEAVRLRAKGLPLQEVMETDIPKTTFYRELYRLEVEGGIATQEPTPRIQYGATQLLPLPRTWLPIHVQPST